MARAVSNSRSSIISNTICNITIQKQIFYFFYCALSGRNSRWLLLAEVSSQ
uniref:Uncharacterized protein MANES_01G021200 n=1 Tax=Rhizophora mucronata TaxID=61149 RepID=A0A2P2LN94_RHIMU